MEEIFDWIKENKVKSALIAITLFFSPLIIVNLLFKWHSNIFLLEAEWSAGDLITYIAGFEAFIGTVVLSVLALWQNNKFKKLNDEKDMLFLQVENEKIRLSYLPQFLVQTADSEKCVDMRYQLSAKYQDKYVPLNKFKTYGFFIKEDDSEWIPLDDHPIIEKETVNRIFAIVNCGNNTAHQVKLSICIGEKCYPSEKSSSVQKDNEIFFYFGLNQHVSVDEKIILVIRFFDCFKTFMSKNLRL